VQPCATCVTHQPPHASHLNMHWQMDAAAHASGHMRSSRTRIPMPDSMLLGPCPSSAEPLRTNIKHRRHSQKTVLVRGTKRPNTRKFAHQTAKQTVNIQTCSAQQPGSCRVLACANSGTTTIRGHLKSCNPNPSSQVHLPDPGIRHAQSGCALPPTPTWHAAGQQAYEYTRGAQHTCQEAQASHIVQQKQHVCFTGRAGRAPHAERQSVSTSSAARRVRWAAAVWWSRIAAA
jgi:hypothetical protein